MNNKLQEMIRLGYNPLTFRGEREFEEVRRKTKKRTHHKNEDKIKSSEYHKEKHQEKNLTLTVDYNLDVNSDFVEVDRVILDRQSSEEEFIDWAEHSIDFGMDNIANEQNLSILKETGESTCFKNQHLTLATDPLCQGLEYDIKTVFHVKNTLKHVSKIDVLNRYLNWIFEFYSLKEEEVGEFECYITSGVSYTDEAKTIEFGVELIDDKLIIKDIFLMSLISEELDPINVDQFMKESFNKYWTTRDAAQKLKTLLANHILPYIDVMEKPCCLNEIGFVTSTWYIAIGDLRESDYPHLIKGTNHLMAVGYNGYAIMKITALGGFFGFTLHPFPKLQTNDSTFNPSLYTIRENDYELSYPCVKELANGIINVNISNEDVLNLSEIRDQISQSLEERLQLSRRIREVVLPEGVECESDKLEYKLLSRVNQPGIWNDVYLELTGKFSAIIKDKKYIVTKLNILFDQYAGHLNAIPDSHDIIIGKTNINGQDCVILYGIAKVIATKSLYEAYALEPIIVGRRDVKNEEVMPWDKIEMLRMMELDCLSKTGIRLRCDDILKQLFFLDSRTFFRLGAVQNMVSSITFIKDIIQRNKEWSWAEDVPEKKQFKIKFQETIRSVSIGIKCHKFCEEHWNKREISTDCSNCINAYQEILYNNDEISNGVKENEIDCFFNNKTILMSYKEKGDGIEERCQECFKIFANSIFANLCRRTHAIRETYLKPTFINTIIPGIKLPNTFIYRGSTKLKQWMSLRTKKHFIVYPDYKVEKLLRQMLALELYSMNKPHNIRLDDNVSEFYEGEFEVEEINNLLRKIRAKINSAKREEPFRYSVPIQIYDIWNI